MTGPGGARRIAAIDCGTNSIRLLVTELDPATGELLELDRRMEIVRLGQGIDATGQFAPDALERTFLACDRFAAVIGEAGVDRIRFVATSATRDAGNRDRFIDGVRERLGVEPEVISGEEEANLSYQGATHALGQASATGQDFPTPYLVVDIGGGSTEFVLGTRRVEAARSVDVGCVRMTERHLLGDPPTLAQITAANRDIDAAIDLVAADFTARDAPLGGAKTLVGVAGSVTTVAAIALGLGKYDRSRVHLARIPADTIREVAGDLLAMTRTQRAAIPVIHPGRVDVIGAGALVLARIVDRLALAEIVASEHDILDGIALSLG
jgi:exopolyphosphatase / guanosine-5'-triphosphate,3'-diphosphate pyrophosphatase